MLSLKFTGLAGSRLIRRRFLHNPKKEIAFVFDIDGVLLRGKKPIPRASEALKLLNSHKVSFILLTNGGGVTEKQRVEFISSQLNVDLSPLQIVQSHTPMKAITNDYSRVLVVGPSASRQAALNYGFKDVIMPIDLVKHTPAISPHHTYSSEDLKNAPNISTDQPIDAVLVLNDPRDMNSDLQIIMDILNSDQGKIGTLRSLNHLRNPETPSVPIIFSNNDLLWANDYELSRFGQGAFRIIIESLYRELTKLSPNQNLKLTILGKPYKIQYDYAHYVLIDWRQRLHNGSNVKNIEQILPPLGQTPKDSPFEKVYMVGDNPESDILGANNYGWESMLLRTGVYKDQNWNHIIAQPTCGVFDDVFDSVTFALKKNGY